MKPPLKTYECPFCHSHISKEQYEKVIKENKLLKEKAEQLEKELSILRSKEIEFKEKEKKFKKEKDEAVKKARILEMQKHGSELEKYKKLIIQQTAEIERLKKGKTVQEEGFDFENEMHRLLEQTFPNDEVEKTGKKGDSLVKIKNRNKIIGIILIECKKVQKHAPEHVDEVKRHKISAKADVGILVTNGDFGKSVKMDGFKNINGILVIRPNSAIEFVALLRKHLLEIDNLKITGEEKIKEMERLWQFIHSQEFESQIDSILREVNQLQSLDSKEKELLEKREKIEQKIINAHALILDGIKEAKKRE